MGRKMEVDFRESNDSIDFPGGGGKIRKQKWLWTCQVKTYRGGGGDRKGERANQGSKGMEISKMGGNCNT